MRGFSFGLYWSLCYVSRALSSWLFPCFVDVCILFQVDYCTGEIIMYVTTYSLQLSILVSTRSQTPRSASTLLGHIRSRSSGNL